MAFDHPHQLNLKRRTTMAGRSLSDLPIVRDRRGRIIYKWDAYYSDCDDPLDQRRRDIWELAEALDAERLRSEAAQATIAQARQRRLDAIEIDPAELGHHHPSDDIDDFAPDMAAMIADRAAGA